MEKNLRETIFLSPLVQHNENRNTDNSLWLDDSKLSWARWNDARNNVRVKREWIWNLTWTDHWGLNDSETHRSARERILRYFFHVVFHTRHAGGFTLPFYWLFSFYLIFYHRWWRFWGNFSRGRALFSKKWFDKFVNKSLSINLLDDSFLVIISQRST